MHPNPIYRKTGTAKNISFAQDRSFGTLAVNHPDGPFLSHIPFQLSNDGQWLEAHLVRSNPIVRLLKAPLRANIAVSGPDGYISPDWYGIPDQVPTWNYVSVQIKGELRLLEQDKLRGVLDRLSMAMEARLSPKTPWTIDKMTRDTFDKMARQIVPIQMAVTDIQATWKLSQNKPQDAVVGAISGLNDNGIGSEVETLTALMNLAMQDQ